MHGQKFRVQFLSEAYQFLETVEEKVREKIIYNIDKASRMNDPELLKKLRDDIWEFRTKYAGMQFRLFAFWSKTGKNETLVIATHGIIKKTDKVPEKEINKAINIRKQYLATLNNSEK